MIKIEKEVFVFHYAGKLNVDSCRLAGNATTTNFIVLLTAI